MSARITGAWCSRCGERPADVAGLCRLCEQMLCSFGHAPVRPEPVLITSRPTRFDVLVSAGAAHRSDSPEFERDLRAWIA